MLGRESRLVKLFHIKIHHKSLICFSLLLYKKSEVRVCLPQAVSHQGRSSSHSCHLRGCHWSCEPGPGPGFEECVARLWDPRTLSQCVAVLHTESVSSWQAVWRLDCLCLWVVVSGNASQQPRNGLAPPLVYILFSAVLFSPVVCTGSSQRISD